MNELARDKKHVLKTTVLIMLVAVLASFVFKPAVQAETAEAASAPVAAKVAGDDSVKTIEVGSFLNNIWQ